MILLQLDSGQSRTGQDKAQHAKDIEESFRISAGRKIY